MVIFLLVIITVLGACSSNVRLKKEVFDKVEIGMTKDDVNAILGEPYDKRGMISGDSLYKFVKEKDLFTLKFADVHFDKSGRVSFLSYGVPGY